MVVPTEIVKYLTGFVHQENVEEMIKESARIYFNGTDITVNLFPAIIIGLLALLGLLVALGIPILSMLGIGEDSQSVSTSGYGEIGSGYGYGSSYSSRNGEAYEETVKNLQRQINQLEESNNLIEKEFYYRPASSFESLNLNQIE